VERGIAREFRAPLEIARLLSQVGFLKVSDSKVGLITGVLRRRRRQAWNSEWHVASPSCKRRGRDCCRFGIIRLLLQERWKMRCIVDVTALAKDPERVFARREIRLQLDSRWNSRLRGPVTSFSKRFPRYSVLRAAVLELTAALAQL